MTHLEVDVPVVAPLDVEAGEARDARPREVTHEEVAVHHARAAPLAVEVVAVPGPLVARPRRVGDDDLRPVLVHLCVDGVDR